MAEYIEREALKKKFCEWCNKEYEDEPCEPDECPLRTMIIEAHAADVVEVRYGKWIKGRKEKLYYNDDMSGFYDFPVTCSVCKFDITDEGFYETDFCPNCGAKMDGDTK